MRKMEMKTKILLSLLPLLFLLVSCDTTRCNNSGCNYRKSGYYLMKTFPSMTSHSSNQTGFSSSKHAYKGKEFCSSSCATDWYRKR